MSKKAYYTFAILALVLIVFLSGCGAEDGNGESQLSDFCDGAVTVYNVPTTNEPEVTYNDFEAFVVKPSKECDVLPDLYCVFSDISTFGGGSSCVVLEE